MRHGRFFNDPHAGWGFFEQRGMGGGHMWHAMAHGGFKPGRGGGHDFFGGRGHGGPGGGGFGGRGRRRRMFDQSELQVLLLALIAELPRHGYDLIREIESMSDGEYAPSPGVVYPALTYMEEAGLIVASAEEGARKSFAVTDEGRVRVEAEAEKVKELKQRLRALADERDKIDPAPVRRAMQALKMATFERLSGDKVDRDLILQIADAVDEATRKIERIQG